MRRSSRRYVINIVAFVVVLTTILYLNTPASSSSTYQWTTIRYMTTSATIPASHGICPGLNRDAAKPVLVVSRVEADGNSKWVRALADKYHLCIYEVDSIASSKTDNFLQVPENRGHEAMAYLTFMIDNYDALPASGIVFVHGSRWAWHNDHPEYDNAALLAALNTTSALAAHGYHNLRCDWSAGTCAKSNSPPQGSLETSFTAMVDPFNARAVSDAALPSALETLFGDSESGVREKLRLARSHALRAQCCAQFVVARENIWRHSRQEYVALRQWLLDGSRGNRGAGPARSRNAAPADDRVAGRILSYVWHILFLHTDRTHISKSTRAAAVDLQTLNDFACPTAAECYCRLYGRCNLPNCQSPASCAGQYRLPKDYTLPKNWAETHS